MNFKICFRHLSFQYNENDLGGKCSSAQLVTRTSSYFIITFSNPFDHTFILQNNEPRPEVILQLLQMDGADKAEAVPPRNLHKD